MLHKDFIGGLGGLLLLGHVLVLGLQLWLRNATNGSCIVLRCLETLRLGAHLELLLLMMLGKSTTASCRLLRHRRHENHLLRLLELLGLSVVAIAWIG